ncbi:putative phosphoesterase [Trichinella pseudospiralis]
MLSTIRRTERRLAALTRGARFNVDGEGVSLMLTTCCLNNEQFFSIILTPSSSSSFDGYFIGEKAENFLRHLSIGQ